jgi:hypothetical protein
LAVLAGGVLLATFEIHQIYNWIIQQVPNNTGYRIALAIGVMLVGILGLWPIRKHARRGKKIEFQSKHGYIVIELDSVQRSLQKAMSKLPEVKDISLTVSPADNNRKVRIVADAVVYKAPGAGIRETASELEDKLAKAAMRMLGVDDIASLDLNISRTIMNVKKEVNATTDAARMIEHKAQSSFGPDSAPAASSSDQRSPEIKTSGGAVSDGQPSSSNGEGSSAESSKAEQEERKGLWR